MIIATSNSTLSNIDFTEGCVILIDKDPDWTSFDVVNKIRNTLPVRKVGHAGTLDPLATGLVIVCSGKYTKRLNDFMGQEKEYTGTISLGTTTPSFDLETPLEVFADPSNLSDSEIIEATKQFCGIIQQVPPIYSGVKVDGERAYKKARKKETTILSPRQVEVKQFEITQIELPLIHFELVCSKGTYVRSIAHDLGQVLKVGGHLSSLRRTRIGEFNVESAWNVQNFVSSYCNSQG